MRDRGRHLASVLPSVLVFVFYGPALHRYFTSEDFLLVRVLGEHPPWRDPDLWTAPWLGVTVVKFYRPVSTLLYGLEIAAFGPWVIGYNLVHTLVHAANVVLVFAIVRRLVAGVPAPSPFIPAFVAALFALYPLHPNAVLFGASFATVFGSGFVLGSFLAYQCFRETGGWRPWAASFAMFVLALGSYETAATLPFLLVAFDWVVARGNNAPGRRPALASLPFFGALALYFLLRRAVFGVFVGGYDDYSVRLIQPELWLEDLAASIRQLHAPAFDHAQSPIATLTAAGLVCLAPPVFFALTRHRTGSRFPRLWFFAWTWILISLAPFAFRPSVPGNGRFWYLAAAGVAMATGFLALAIAAALPERWSTLPWAALAAFGVYWGWLLTGSLDVYLTAGRTTRAIQQELVREHAAAGAPQRTFVTRYPYFVYSATGAPLAQVFHYGLRDSVNPPFVRASVPVYPLPPRSRAELLAVFMADPRAVIFEWDGAARRFHRVELPSAPGSSPVEITVLGPQDGAALDPRGLEVKILSGNLERVRMVVVAQGNATIANPPGVPAQGGAVTLAMPAAFVTTMARLYRGGEFLWWVEARDEGERLIGVSRMRSFRLRPSDAPGVTG